MSQWPISGDEELANLREVLDSCKWWRGAYRDHTEGFVGRFEQAWAEYCGAKHCLCVPNGTLALELALTSSGVAPGDEVIVPAVTFAATATAVIRVGAVPVIIDVSPVTYQLLVPQAWNVMDRDDIRFVLPVHYGGATANAFDMYADGRTPRCVVDAAEAAGHAGPWGDVATFSFQAGKQLTCGEGGALITDDDEIAEAMCSQWGAGQLPGKPYSMTRLPFGNFRMSEFQGAVLWAQFQRFEEQRARQLANAALFNQGIADIDGLDAMPWPTTGQHGFYFWHVKFLPGEWPITRDAFLAKLRGMGIACGTGHTLPLHLNRHFRDNAKQGAWRAEPCPEAERIYREEAVSFSHTQFLEQSEVERIIGAIREVRDGA